ncbi:MAG: class I SAM-dependent methyltransferase [Candidatus Bathyarchaeota archaeon]|nr:class I SAM-dependent methyltransferase [Candidatus Bathyarchaeota archaeon]
MEDAFGQEMWACYKGEEASEIVERDDGYFDASPNGPKTYFSKYEDWQLFERKAMEFVRGRVLDVGCGAGRHSLYLQEKGLNVVGIDNSPLAVEVCRLRGLRKAIVMSIEDVNFKPDSFDTIIMMGNNFGLFGSFKKARSLLKRFHKMTSKNGLIIASTRDAYGTDNPDHLEYHRLNKKRGRMGGQLKVRIRFRKYVSKWFDYLIVSKKELGDILEGTGWKIREFIDSAGSEYIAVVGKQV